MNANFSVVCILFTFLVTVDRLNARLTTNATVPVGGRVNLSCTIGDLDYEIPERGVRVLWIRIYDNGSRIVSLQNAVLIDDRRLSVLNPDPRTWILNLDRATTDDAGRYVCVVDTAPKRNFTVHLDVLVELTFVDRHSASNVPAREGDDVVLDCKTDGFPSANVTWHFWDDRGNWSVLGPEDSLVLSPVRREYHGRYVCVADNGLHEPIRKNFTLNVKFFPDIKFERRYVGARIGDEATLKCEVDCNPPCALAWLKDNVLLSDNDKYRLRRTDHPLNVYAQQLILSIKNVAFDDYDGYVCAAANYIGRRNKRAVVFHIRDKVSNTSVNNGCQWKSILLILSMLVLKYATSV